MASRKTPESRVKEKATAILRKHGAYYFFPVAGAIGSRPGIPDIICCVNGKFLAIECKAGSNKPTGLQLAQLGKISDAGGVAIVVNEAALDTLDAIVGGLK